MGVFGEWAPGVTSDILPLTAWWVCLVDAVGSNLVVAIRGSGHVGGTCILDASFARGIFERPSVVMSYLSLGGTLGVPSWF